jgi:hypothetical protein
MNLDSAFIFISIIIALGSIQASLENIVLFYKFPALVNYKLDKGIIKSRLAKKVKYFYNSPGIWFLALIRLCAGFWLLLLSILGEIHFLPVFLLIITDLMGWARWKYFPVSEIPMQRVILIAIFVHAYFDIAKVSEIVLLFVCAFLCLAYFASGYKKMQDKNWQNGSMPTHFMTNNPIPEVKWKWLGYLIIFFECSFFIGLVSVNFAILFIVIGFLFHFYLYVKHHFNFFFWTFVAAYPAFYYTAHKVSSLIIEWVTL